MSKETTFDCIPEEVLGDILDYIDSTERQRLRRVCIFWNINVTNLYGATLTLNNANLEMTLECSYIRIIAHLQNLTLPIPMTETGIYFMNRLTSLSLTGMIVCYNIYPVFVNCSHIRKLEFIRFYVNPSLKQYEVNTDDPSKLLPELRDLTIKFLDRPFATAAEYKFLKTLLPFFKPSNSNSIGKLNKIVLESAGTNGPLEISSNKIFGTNCFIMDEYRIIKNTSPPPPIEIDIVNQFYTEVVQTNLNTLSCLELADAEYGTRIKMKNFLKAEGKSTVLQIAGFDQTLMSGFRFNYSNHGGYNILMIPFLSAQTHLTTLSIILSRTILLEQIYAVANGNATTLKSLSMRYQYQERLNATAISQLNNLRILKFEPVLIDQTRLWRMFKETLARIVNINHLPTSLRVLIIYGSLEFLNEEDLNQAFFNNLRNLEILKILATPFFRFPNKNIYVMESWTVRRLIAWLPKLKELVLRNSRPTTFEFIHKVDALPNNATDWISTATSISFQKIPFICPDPDIPDEVSRVFETGPPADGNDNLIPENGVAGVYDFPVYFDGMI